MCDRPTQLCKRRLKNTWRWLREAQSGIHSTLSTTTQNDKATQAEHGVFVYMGFSLRAEDVLLQFAPIWPYVRRSPLFFTDITDVEEERREAEHTTGCEVFLWNDFGIRDAH